MTRARWAVVAALALVASFVGGRYSRPARVEERVRVETKTVTQIEYRDRVVARQVRGPIRVVEHITERPGPERVIVRTIDRGPVTTNVDSTAEGNGTQTATGTTERIRIVEAPRPGWAAGVTGGWASVSAKPERLGVEIDRRLFGTVWLGVRASATTTAAEPQVGLALRLEF